MFENGQT